jgi:hypothetical protein
MILEKAQFRTAEQITSTCTQEEARIVVRTSVTKKVLIEIIKQSF